MPRTPRRRADARTTIRGRGWWRPSAARIAARLPRSTGEVAVASTILSSIGRSDATAWMARTSQMRTTSASRPTSQPSASEDHVDDPVGGPAVDVVEVACGKRGDLLDLVRVATDRVEELGERADDRTRDELLVWRVEPTRRDVVLEVVGEEQHRLAECGELEDDGRIVGDEEVHRGQQVVDLDPRSRPVKEPVRELVGDQERPADERVHPKDDDGVLLDAHGVECRVVEELEVVACAARAVAAERRREQDREATPRLRKARERRQPVSLPPGRIEEPIHPWNAGRVDA